jgi:hypothetical protein
MLMSMLHVHVHASCPSPYCMLMSMLHVPVHAACTRPLCTLMSMLKIFAHANVHVFAKTSVSMGTGHVACTYSTAWTYGMDMMDMNMKYGHGHAA